MLYWEKSQFPQSKAAKDLRVIIANSIGDEKNITDFNRISKEFSYMKYANTEACFKRRASHAPNALKTIDNHYHAGSIPDCCTIFYSNTIEI